MGSRQLAWSGRSSLFANTVHPERLYVSSPMPSWPPPLLKVILCLATPLLPLCGSAKKPSVILPVTDSYDK